MMYSQFPTSDPLFTLFYPALGPWRLTSIDCITQAPLPSGFQWVWPMGELCGGGRRTRELRGKRELDIYFSNSLSARSHLAVIVFLFLVPHRLLGCPFLKASAFTMFCSPFHFRPKDGTASPCCPIACPLHPAHTFSYTF